MKIKDIENASKLKNELEVIERVIKRIEQESNPRNLSLRFYGYKGDHIFDRGMINLGIDFCKYVQERYLLQLIAEKTKIEGLIANIH